MEIEGYNQHSTAPANMYPAGTAAFDIQAGNLIRACTLNLISSGGYAVGQPCRVHLYNVQV